MCELVILVNLCISLLLSHGRHLFNEKVSITWYPFSNSVEISKPVVRSTECTEAVKLPAESVSDLAPVR